MFGRYSPRKVGGEILDFEDNTGVKQISLEGIVPRVRQVPFSHPSDARGTRLEINEVAYPFRGNTSLAPHKPPEEMTRSEVKDHNNLSIDASLARRGLLVCGGDDHLATDWAGRVYDSSLPFYRHPDASPEGLTELGNVIRRNLGGMPVASGSSTYDVPRHPITQPEVSTATDLALAEEGFESLAQIYHEHMQNLRGRNDPSF